MPEKNGLDRVTTDLGEETLAALATILETAGDVLRSPRQGASSAGLATPANKTASETRPDGSLVPANAEEQAKLDLLLPAPLMASLRFRN